MILDNANGDIISFINSQNHIHQNYHHRVHYLQRKNLLTKDKDKYYLI